MQKPFDYTTVLAVDKETSRDLRGVWPTWRMLKPQLLQHPMLVICDAQAGDTIYWEHRLRFLREHPRLRLVQWDWPNQDDSDLANMDQRERMLTAFVKVPPAMVETPYWLKIDCDVVAHAPGDFIKLQWFAPGQYPSLIGPGWHYTKPATLPGILDRWAATIPQLAPFPALNLPEPEPDEEIIATKRVCSWFMFISTAFSKLAADLCPGRLPVPSQDTLHWYIAQRRGDNIIRHQFRNDGWQTISGRRRREALIAKVIEQHAPTRGCRDCS